jgi:protein SCO1/2
MATRKLLISLTLVALSISAVAAQNPDGMAEPGQPTSARPGLLSKIAIDQRIGHQVPLDLPFVDDSGTPAKLGDYFGKRPVVLALV